MDSTGLRMIISAQSRARERGRRVEERIEEHWHARYLALLRTPADARDAGRRASQELGREVPERADHARLEQLDLALEVWPAGRDLVGLGIAVAGRTALQDVRDE